MHTAEHTHTHGTHTTKRRIRGYKLTLLQTNKRNRQSDKTDAGPHTGVVSSQDGRGTDGRTRPSPPSQHSVATAMQCASQHAAHAQECCKHAGSTPGQPSQRPVYGSVLHSRAPAPGQSNAERGSSAHAGWSVGLVGKRRPARCNAGSIATASSPTGALCTGRGRRCRAAAPLRDGGRHRTHSLAAVASFSGLQLVAKSPSPAMRVAHRMHACWLRRLRACGPASSVRLALHACTRALYPTSRARSAGRPLLSWFG